MIITEFNSVEEFAQSWQQAPVIAARFFNYESYPLIELDEKTLEAWQESLKAAE